MKFSIHLVSLLFLFIAHPSLGKDRSYCTNPGFYELELPVYPGRADTRFFTYRYQYVKTSNFTNAPTIVILPGGPGGTSTTASWSPEVSHFFYGVPKSGANVLLIDPRGNGCNLLDNAPLPEDSLTTDNLVSDVLALIKKLDLQDYYLSGHSYGTVWATQVAFRAETELHQPPRGIILTGVIGRAWKPTEESIVQGYLDEWQRIIPALSPKVLERLRRDPLPFGQSSSAWASFIQHGLVLGKEYSLGKSQNALLASLSALERTDTEELKVLENKVASFSQRSNPALETIYRNIACRELYQGATDNNNLGFENGQFTRDPDIACNQVRLTKPYDSAQWQFRAPVYYFQGENDPAVPLWQARFHFENQHASKRRTFVTILKAGHAPLGGNLLECKDKLWAAIIADSPIALKSVLSKCGSPTTVEFDD